ncbi:TetR/AcrR family transcriptional regulator [Negadavirga shengliensis]|uniref:TetR family transcriptional regulator C-terminal domain-containing protein n=1 Tax=Negadavirga shengliensis TaxID=1389218 RepID=A0ABV9T436_9BACT
MTEKNQSKSRNTDQRSKIIEGYVEHVLENGEEPVSVFKFAKGLKMKEEVFYEYFTSFEGIKNAVWEMIFDHTKADLESQEVYPSYTAREKLLGFFFTWVEELKKKRSYLLAVYGDKPVVPIPTSSEWKGFKEKFRDFVKEVILEGKETEEIADRPYISDKYDEALWLQLIFVFRFWIKDTSPGFEKTDAAIEKSVNLAFDLMGKSAVDSFVDFAKFLFQSR